MTGQNKLICLGVVFSFPSTQPTYHLLLGKETVLCIYGTNYSTQVLTTSPSQNQHVEAANNCSMFSSSCKYL